MISIVGFPNLNLYFDINPIAFKLFNIDIYWYGIILVLAYVIGVIFVRMNDGLYEIKWEQVIETLTFSILFGVIGSRLYYVIFNLDYYRYNLNEIIKIYNGGLAIYGGLIAGIITIYVISKRQQFNFTDMLDYVIPYIALGQAIGRFGNFFNIEAYGNITNSFLKMQVLDNITKQYITVHPTFLYESVLTLSIFLILYINRKARGYKGEQTYLYMILYGLGRTYIEELRVDSLMLGSIRVSQVLSLIICILGIALILINIIKERKIDKKKTKNRVFCKIS